MRTPDARRAPFGLCSGQEALAVALVGWLGWKCSPVGCRAVAPSHGSNSPCRYMGDIWVPDLRRGKHCPPTQSPRQGRSARCRAGGVVSLFGLVQPLHPCRGSGPSSPACLPHGVVGGEHGAHSTTTPNQVPAPPCTDNSPPPAAQAVQHHWWMPPTARPLTLPVPALSSCALERGSTETLWGGGAAEP